MPFSIFANRYSINYGGYNDLSKPIATEKQKKREKSKLQSL